MTASEIGSDLMLCSFTGGGWLTVGLLVHAFVSAFDLINLSPAPSLAELLKRMILLSFGTCCGTLGSKTQGKIAASYDY